MTHRTQSTSAKGKSHTADSSWALPRHTLSPGSRSSPGCGDIWICTRTFSVSPFASVPLQHHHSSPRPLHRSCLAALPWPRLLTFCQADSQEPASQRPQGNQGVWDSGCRMRPHCFAPQQTASEGQQGRDQEGTGTHAASTDIPALLSHYGLSGALGNVKHAQSVCTPCVTIPPEQEAGQGGTDRDDTGVVGDEVPGSDVPRLVLVAANVQRELHGALRAELITRAVLAHTRVPHAGNCQSFPSDQTLTTPKMNPHSISLDSPWNIASYPQCHRW